MKNRIIRLIIISTVFLEPFMASCNAAPQRAISKRTLYVDAAATAGDGSQQKPFSTIGAALNVVQPGDTITLGSGTYREQVNLPSGAENAPITLMAQPGARAIISGFEPITGWKPWKDNIHVTTVDQQPDDLYVGATVQPMARFPNQGWGTLEAITGDAATGLKLIDNEGLGKLTSNPVGGHAQIFQSKNIGYFSLPIAGFDKATGTVTLGATDKKPALVPGDRYLLKNRVDLIDRPGEWAVQPEEGGKSFKIYFWPPKVDDLKNTQTQRIGRRVVSISAASNVRLEGLEVAGGLDNGIEVNNSSNVTITRCIAHSNGKVGIYMRGIQDATISHCISMHNSSGIIAASARNVTIEENEIAYNIVDGLVIGGDISGKYGTPQANPQSISDGILLRRNYIHHHLLWSHPDNIQFYRGVKNVKLQENLAIGSGQGLMTEQVDGGELNGNVFLSSGAMLVIFGHGNSNEWKVENNTFLFPGYAVFNFTGKNYDVRDNVYIGTVATKETSNYTGDRNIYGQGPSIKVTLKAPNQDANSIKGDPMLVAAPKAHSVIDFRQAQAADTIALRGGAADWQNGDIIEVNWDNVPRTVTKVEGSKVTFTPALPATPFSVMGVAINWGDNKERKLDTRLRPESPGAKLDEGKPIGATLNVAAYQAGDFDGDGQRDLPSLPDDVKAGIPDPNDMIPPSY